MCSEKTSELWYPIGPKHLNALSENYKHLPDGFLRKFLAIATNGIHTEIIVANTLLTIVDNLFANKVDESGSWKNKTSYVLFSELSIDGSKKYQTKEMEILHDRVIPWLATENAREYEKLLSDYGIKRIFMHSCGEIAVFKKDWDEKKLEGLLKEQSRRTEIDCTVGTQKLNHKKIFELTKVNSERLQERLFVLKKIIKRSRDMVHANKISIAS